MTAVGTICHVFCTDYVWAQYDKGKKRFKLWWINSTFQIDRQTQKKYTEVPTYNCQVLGFLGLRIAAMPVDSQSFDCVKARQLGAVEISVGSLEVAS